MTHIAFIGFGEAAQAMAQGFGDEPGVAGLSAHDLRFGDAESGPELRERARERKVRVANTPADAVSGADIVLSLVVGSAAAAVGEAVGPALQPGQIFVDLNSISPDAKEAVGAALARGGRRRSSRARSWRACRPIATKCRSCSPGARRNARRR